MREERAARSSPFQGLDPFGLEDTAYFAGRDRDIRLIAANALTSGSLLLYGASGIGKSSVLLAGVVPHLRGKPGVLVAVCRDWSGDPVASVGEAVVGAAREAKHQPPTSTPLADLLLDCASALRRRVVLVLDQFEDHLAREVAADPLVAALGEALAVPELPLSVVISIREESLAALDRFEGWVPELFDSVYRLTPLDHDAGEKAIRAPLAIWNEAEPECRMDVEDGFVSLLLGSIPSAAGPEWIETAHLQLVLERVWREETEAGSHVLHEATLRHLGGTSAIVNEHVESALRSLDRREQALASVVLDRLVTPSGARVAHSAGDLAKVAGVPEPEVDALLNKLAAARVLRPVARPDGGEAFEVFHASLADAALEWRTRYVAEQRAARERRRAQRLAVVAVVLAIALAGVAALAVYAWTTRQTARSQAYAAAALAQLDVDPGLSLALALKGVETKQTNGSVVALRTALQASHERARLTGHILPVESVDFGSAGVLTAGEDGTVRLWNPATGRQLRVVARRQDEVFGASFCPSADRIAIAAGDGAVILAGARKIPLVHGSSGEDEPAQAEAIACTPDGSRIATADSGGLARIFDSDGRRIATPVRDVGPSPPAKVAWAPDGSLLAVSDDSGVAVWSGNGRRLVRFVRVPKTPSVAVTSAGTLAIGDDQGEVRLDRPAGRGSREVVLGRHERAVTAIAFSPDGSLVASASVDGTIRLWDVRARQEVGILRGHVGIVRGIAFSPDGSLLASAGADGTARVWRVPVKVLGAEGEPIFAVTAEDGLVASLWAGGSVRVFDATSGEERGRLHAEGAEDVVLAPGGGHVLVLGFGRPAGLYTLGKAGRVVLPISSSAQFAPDGQLFVLGGGRSVQLLGLDGKPRRAFRPPGSQESTVTAVAFSPDGGRLAVGTFPRGEIAILDAVSGRVLTRLERPHEGVRSIVFSPDGKRVVTTARGDNAALVWDARSGKLEHRLRGGDEAVGRAVFSPDGGLVLTISDGSGVLWDAATGRRLGSFVADDAAFASGRAGTLIVTGGPGSTVHVVPCDLCGSASALRTRAQERITRSAKERDRALG